MNTKHNIIVGGTRGIACALVHNLPEEEHVLSIIGSKPTEDAHLSIHNAHYWTVDLLDRKRLISVLIEIIQQNGKLNHLIGLQRYRGEGDDWVEDIETTTSCVSFFIQRAGIEALKGKQVEGYVRLCYANSI